MTTEEKILLAMGDAERKAWDSLARYKFFMFGYHAAAWVKYNALLSKKEKNPFGCAVKMARKKVEELEQ